jgi:hypothetical protein
LLAGMKLKAIAVSLMEGDAKPVNLKRVSPER